MNTLKKMKYIEVTVYCHNTAADRDMSERQLRSSSAQVGAEVAKYMKTLPESLICRVTNENGACVVHVGNYQFTAHQSDIEHFHRIKNRIKHLLTVSKFSNRGISRILDHMYLSKVHMINMKYVDEKKKLKIYTGLHDFTYDVDLDDHTIKYDEYDIDLYTDGLEVYKKNYDETLKDIKSELWAALKKYFRPCINDPLSSPEPRNVRVILSSTHYIEIIEDEITFGMFNKKVSGKIMGPEMNEWSNYIHKFAMKNRAYAILRNALSPAVLYSAKDISFNLHDQGFGETNESVTVRGQNVTVKRRTGAIVNIPLSHFVNIALRNTRNRARNSARNI
jgi:hypothetical protein